MSDITAPSGSSLDPRLAGFIETLIAGSPLAQKLGIRFVAAEVGKAVLAIPYDPANVTLGDTVHGGAIAALLDTAAAASNGSVADPDTTKGGATATLSIAYLAAARACDLTATAVIVQRGKSQTASDVEVRDSEGRLVAKGLVTSRLF